MTEPKSTLTALTRSSSLSNSSTSDQETSRGVASAVGTDCGGCVMCLLRTLGMHLTVHAANSFARLESAARYQRIQLSSALSTVQLVKYLIWLLGEYWSPKAIREVVPHAPS